MITWNLTLSGQQISLLKLFSGRVYGKPDDMAQWSREHHRSIGLHPNTIPGTRTLIREGLVEHKETRNASGYMDQARSGHYLTERGRFILSMIETDIDKFLSVESQHRAKKRGLRKAS
jgi:hypothetical protein